MGESEIRGTGSKNTLVGTKNKKRIGKLRKANKIRWGNKIKSDISNLVLREQVELYDVLRVVRKFERKCEQELKNLVRAPKLLLVMSDILRSLKILSNEVEGTGQASKAKIYAAFGLILTKIISASMRKKCSPENAKKLALELSEFIRRILDFNSNWIFNTILSSEVASTASATSSSSPFSQSLLSLILNDPLLVLDVDYIGRKAKATLLLIEPKISKHKAKFARGWTTQEGFCKPLVVSDIVKIVNDCKKRIKIVIPKTPQIPLCREDANHGEESETPGVSWGISTTPGALYEGSDSDSADSTVEIELDDTATFSDVEQNEASNLHETASKRLRIRPYEDQSTDAEDDIS